MNAPVAPLPLRESAVLQRVGGSLARWALTRRRRRLVFLALTAPGFLSVFTTPLHRNLAMLVVGLLLFAAACVFRALTEPVFARAEAARLWPPARPAHPQEKSDD
jgi:hypothetical protein